MDSQRCLVRLWGDGWLLFIKAILAVGWVAGHRKNIEMEGSLFQYSNDS